LAEVYMTLVGPIRTDLFKYRFGHPAKNNLPHRRMGRRGPKEREIA
jgi:hypothetical protein